MITHTLFTPWHIVNNGNLYRDHSVPGPEPSISFGWILDDVMDVTSMIIAFSEGEAKAALF